MESVKGLNVLVTDAAMGLGKLFAANAVSEGAAAVVLWDANEVALKETAAYVPSPLSGLFTRLNGALTLGESTRSAVRRVSDTARVTEFDLFCEVLALHSESGGNLPAMLDRLAASIRDRNQYRGYFRSVTTLARVSAYFVALAAPVAFAVYWIFPDQRVMMKKFVAMPEGQTMLAIAVGLEVLGLVWITLLLRRQDDY